MGSTEGRVVPQKAEARAKLVQMTAGKRRLVAEVTVLNACQKHTARYNRCLVAPRLYRLGILESDTQSLTASMFTKGGSGGICIVELIRRGPWRGTGKEARMGSIGDQTLYEDEFYVVLQNEDREIITLVMPKRRMALEFTYQEWEELRSIVSGISSADIPETKEYEKVVLYEDEMHLFYGHNDYIEWAIEDRMVSVGWHHQGWDRFRAMMAAIGHVPWSII